MKHFFAAVSLALLSSISAAQVVTYESVRLADMLIEGTWQTMEQSFPAMITGLESDLRSGGATERASKVLAEETRRTLTRDNFTRFIAQALSEKLNEGELREIGAFLNSGAGQKWLRMSNDISASLKFLLPMVRQACDAANRQLSASDRGSLSKACAF